MKLKRSERVHLKDSKRFYLDELIHPNIYANSVHGGAKSIKFLNKDLIKLLIFIRERYKMPITVNNWGSGGSFINSGLRDYIQPLGGKASRSRHYYGLALDLKFNIKAERKEREKLIKFVYNDILKNEELFLNVGLTVLEDVNFTPTWLHISVEQTELSTIKIIKP